MRTEKVPDGGERLRMHRVAAGLTQAELARLVGRDQSRISGLERQRALPGAENLVALASALGVSCDDLVGKAPAPNTVQLEGWDLLAPEDRSVVLELVESLVRRRRGRRKAANKSDAAESRGGA